MKSRRNQSLDIRYEAANLAAARPHPVHQSNGDEGRHRFQDGRPSYVGNFSKGLPHDNDGFLIDPNDYHAWVRAIDSGDPRDFQTLRLGPGPFQANGDFQYVNPNDPDSSPILNWAHTYTDAPGVRAWESQGAGLTFDLEGPDAQAVTMPPCPSLDSQELIAEMGEVYWMALCRDVPFADWGNDPTINDARESLKRFWWFRGDQTPLQLPGATDNLPTSLARRRIMSEDGTESVPLEKLFRGVTPGEQVGPYLSQFLLIGNTGIDSAQPINDGMIAYGAIRADQRVRVATDEKDYMQNWNEWLDVQNGADLRNRETYASGYRFMATPRDLATYVHFDALYEAYLNACLILLGLGAPFDPGLPFQIADYKDKQQGFAQFGGPHILTLVPEVATRALKAVRYQKFNIHRRLRPEALGGWLYQRRNGNANIQERLLALENMEAAFLGSSNVGDRLDTKNGTGNWLLPMAFPEGSPMHPSYGAGHATVAGACTTILKAWFDHGWGLTDGGGIIAYEPLDNGSGLNDVSGTLSQPLTVEGELNKVGANIAIGRDWAGVHYYTDYIESFRMGEQIAIGLLEEQKLTYGENFSLTVPMFDGTAVRI